MTSDYATLDGKELFLTKNLRGRMVFKTKYQTKEMFYCNVCHTPTYNRTKFDYYCIAGCSRPHSLERIFCSDECHMYEFFREGYI